MTTRDQLLVAMGSTLSVLGAGGALAPALRTLRDACAALLVELNERRPPKEEAPPLPKNCDNGHAWIVSHGINRATGKPVARRRCAVCRLADEVEVIPAPYKRR